MSPESKLLALAVVVCVASLIGTAASGLSLICACRAAMDSSRLLVLTGERLARLEDENADLWGAIQELHGPQPAAQKMPEVAAEVGFETAPEPFGVQSW
jgi:hypothetical protein